MGIELRLEWNKEIPYKDCNEFTVSAIVRDVKNLKLKNIYQGTLSRIAAENYHASIVYDIKGTGSDEKITEIYFIGNVGESRIKKYDEEKNGMKIITISTENINEPKDLTRTLERLEEKWYIEPRDEIVNDCDYWYGFFGTSCNLWSDSSYPKANPAEWARQLAYDVKHDIRNVKNWSIWFFPGYFYLSENMGKNKRVKNLVGGINDFIGENSKMQAGKDIIISELLNFANKYEKLIKNQ